MNAPRWDFALGDPQVQGGGLDVEPGGHVFDGEEHLNPSPGESDDTPGPPSALASVRQRLFGGGAVPPSIGPAFLRSSRPARCYAHRPATRICPCPGLLRGAGNSLVIGPAPSVDPYPIWSRIPVRLVRSSPARFALLLSSL